MGSIRVAWVRGLAALTLAASLAVTPPARAQSGDGGARDGDGHHPWAHARRGGGDPRGRDPRGDHDAPRGGDPLVPMLARIDRFLQRHEEQGVVVDARVVVNETEAIRLSVVSQLLGYTELYKVVPRARLRQDITDRADYLIARFDEVRSGSVFDGMFGFALLEAYSATHEARYLDYGARVAAELLALPRTERILNGGLMGAMALAKYDALAGSPDARQFVDDAMASLPAYQHSNGSFPHWCVCSTDIHYTDWMTTELILIRRVSPRPDIAPLLDRMEAFLDSRIDARGMTRYEDSCAAYPGCVIPYYSIASGCGIDYDTRAWTNELGYSALLFDDARAPAYSRVMSFMRSLESGGTFPDKWDFWGPTSDPYYVWTAADTSVINTSLIFWSLASVLSGRGGRTPCHELESDPAGPAEPAILTLGRSAAPLAATPEAPRRAVPRAAVDSLLVAGDRPLYCDAATAPSGAPDGTPVAGGAPAAAPATASGLARAGALGVAIRGRPGAAVLAIRLSLPSAGPASLAVFDAGGRRVRDLEAAGRGPGESRLGWDLRDAAGRPCASGVYFVVLRQGGLVAVARTAIVR